MLKAGRPSEGKEVVSLTDKKSKRYQDLLDVSPTTRTTLVVDTELLKQYQIALLQNNTNMKKHLTECIQQFVNENS